MIICIRYRIMMIRRRKTVPLRIVIMMKVTTMSMKRDKGKK